MRNAGRSFQKSRRKTSLAIVISASSRTLLMCWCSSLRWMATASLTTPPSHALFGWVRSALLPIIMMMIMYILFYSFHLRHKADRPLPKHKRQLITTWQVFCQVERRLHNWESNRQPLPWDLGISPPSSNSLGSSRTNNDDNNNSHFQALEFETCSERIGFRPERGGDPLQSWWWFSQMCGWAILPPSRNDCPVIYPARN